MEFAADYDNVKFHRSIKNRIMENGRKLQKEISMKCFRSFICECFIFPSGRGEERIPFLRTCGDYLRSIKNCTIIVIKLTPY